MSNGTKTSNKRAEPKEEQRDTSPPIFTRRVWTGSGSVELAVFDKMIEGDNGEYRVFSISAKRVHKEGDEYKTAKSLRPEDLLPLSLFLEEAASFIIAEQSKR